MLRLVLLPILLVATAAAPPQLPQVQTASGTWDDLPRLQSRGYDHLDSNVMQRLWEIASKRQCKLPGYALGKLDMRISFAVQYDQKGALNRVILPKLDCPEAEGLIGGAVIAMIAGGDFSHKGDSPEGWYQGALTFGFEAPA